MQKQNSNYRLPAHFMVSECDGGLYDTRKTDWSKAPLRADYRKSFARIASLAQLKATLRAGGFAWPGGYPLFLHTHDCAALCFECARKEFRRIVSEFRDKSSTGWRVVGCDVNYEDAELTCDHCGKHIESAYAD